jgi:outer membrane protein assembly factor BamB
VESSAAVADGIVYVGSSDWFRVNAVDAQTGELVWDFETKGDPWSSPAVADGVVYIGATGGYLYALDAKNGSELWKVRTGPALATVDPVRFDGGVVSSPTVVAGVVYFGSLDGKLYAVSTASEE